MLILSVGLPQEATVSILHELDEADVKFIALVPEDTPLPDSCYASCNRYGTASTASGSGKTT